MKKILIVALSSIILYSCSTNNGYEINGEVKGAKGEIVYLEKITGQKVTLDSAVLGDNGKFEFVGKADEQGIYRINIANQSAVDLVLDNTSDINLVIDKEKTAVDYEITGSEASQEIKNVNKILANSFKEINDLQEEFLKNQNSPHIDSISKLLDFKYRSVVGKQLSDLKKFIENSKEPIVDIYALSYFNVDENFDFIDKTFEEHKAFIENNEYAKQFYNRFAEYKRLAIGQPAPEINLPDPSGKNISLSSLKGKVVLIDFWASWCGPCRKENPNVVKLYNQYKDKGFTIYGVSLDKNKDDWTKAIMKDNLTWNHVSDLKYWDSAPAVLYKVDAIPATILVDKEGKILAKNLRGEELESTLKKLFN
jgi:peroxiredoxin